MWANQLLSPCLQDPFLVLVNKHNVFFLPLSLSKEKVTFSYMCVCVCLQVYSKAPMIDNVTVKSERLFD